MLDKFPQSFGTSLNQDSTVLKFPLKPIFTLYQMLVQNTY